MREHILTIKVGTGIRSSLAPAQQMLCEHGVMSITEFARTLQRDYKNVHNDVERLMEWLAIVCDEQGKVFTPCSVVWWMLIYLKQRAA